MADAIDDPDIQALTGGDQTVSPSSSALDDPDIKALMAPEAKATSDKRPATISHPAHHEAPTAFKTATAPISPIEPELSWKDTATQAAKNLLPSTGSMLKSVGSAIVHPVETAKAIGHLGEGAVSQAAGAFGLHQDPEQKTKTEAVLRALEDHYKNAYGSVAGLKKYVATDPAGFLTDASSALGGAGAVGKLANVGKAAEIATKAASVIDPMANAVRVAKRAASVVGAPIRAAQAVTTGVPQSALKLATEAGSAAPALRDTFLKYYRGEGDATDFAQAAKHALGQIKQDASNAYLSQKANLKSVNPSFQPIDDAIAEARKQTQYGGSNVGQFAKANDAINEVEQLVNHWKINPAMQDLPGFDNLKQVIWDVRDGYGNSAAQRHLGGIYNAAKQSIIAADPKYAELMENYQAGLNNINDLTKTLSLGNKAAASTTLAKNLRAMKTGTGENLLSQLAHKDPSLPYMLAGASLHPWQAGKFHTALEAAMAVPLTLITHSPLPAVAQFVGQSPKIMGAANYAAGRAGKMATDAVPALKGAYYGSLAGDDAEPTEGQSDPVSLIKAAAAKYGVDPDLNLRVAKQESGLKQEAISPKGAQGVMQLMPKTAESLGVDPSDIKQNIDGGTRLLGQLLEHYDGDKEKALAAYNAGPSKVARALAKGDSWREHLPDETKDYIKSILAMNDDHVSRATGGRVESRSQKVERLVNRLMSLAKTAKTVENKHTEPLLKLADDVVAKALQSAQRGI